MREVRESKEAKIRLEGPDEEETACTLIRSRPSSRRSPSWTSVKYAGASARRLSKSCHNWLSSEVLKDVKLESTGSPPGCDRERAENEILLLYLLLALLGNEARGSDGTSQIRVCNKDRRSCVESVFEDSSASALLVIVFLSLFKTPACM